MRTNINHSLRASLRPATRIAALALAGEATLLTSCAADDLTAPGDNFPEDSRVRISADMEATASTVITRADGTTPYTGADLGIFVNYGTGTAATPVEDPYNRFNVKYNQATDGSGTWTQELTAPDYADLTKGDGFQSSTTALWKNSTTPTTVWAYGPYVESAQAKPTVAESGDLNETVNNRYVLFRIPTNQSDGIEAADLVSGIATDFTPTNGIVSIALKHCLTKFTVAVTLGTEFDGQTVDGTPIDVTSMTMNNTYPVVMLKMGNEKYYTLPANAATMDANLQMHLIPDGNGTPTAFEVIGVPYISFGSKLFTLTLNNGKQYVYAPSHEVARKIQDAMYQQGYGHALRLNLKVGHDKLEIADGTDAVTVVPWDAPIELDNGSGEATPTTLYVDEYTRPVPHP